VVFSSEISKSQKYGFSGLKIRRKTAQSDVDSSGEFVWSVKYSGKPDENGHKKQIDKSILIADNTIQQRKEVNKNPVSSTIDVPLAGR